jgi:predicted permease
MSSALPEIDISGTFLASMRSVGTAVTLAAVGVYLHHRGFVGGEGKRALALISQQVTFPLFLFTKIIYCNQNWSDSPCPDVRKSLEDVWILLIWPVYVVMSGVFVGSLVARVTKTPPHQVRAVLAACAFGNSTGLPITLLTVVHSNFPTTSDLGRIDPTLFLSVYLLLYPVLQWGYGGWLLAPDDDEDEESDDEVSDYGDVTGKNIGDQNRHRPLANTSSTPKSPPKKQRSISDSFRHNVLNNTEIDDYYRHHRQGLSSADEGMYVSELDLVKFAREKTDEENDLSVSSASSGNEEDEPTNTIEVHPLLRTGGGVTGSYGTGLGRDKSIEIEMLKSCREDDPTFWETVKNIASRCFQPPVVGAIAGIIVAVTPLRGIFVDLVDRSSSAPLQWIFDGLYSVGLSAVPINMMILGCNLSTSIQAIQQSRSYNDKALANNTDALFSTGTMVGIAVGKLVVLPVIGITSCLLLKNYILDIPEEIAAAFYLVAMIVFLTPTANNIMVMVELSGSGATEGIASAIALQYAVAPFILTLTMSVAIGVASDWS